MSFQTLTEAELSSLDQLYRATDSSSVPWSEVETQLTAASTVIIGELLLLACRHLLFCIIFCIIFEILRLSRLNFRCVGF